MVVRTYLRRKKKWHKASMDDEGQGSSEETSGGCGPSSEVPFPDIETRVSGKNVLLRVQCKRRKGLLAKILSEVEKHNLVVVNSSVTPFGKRDLAISIIAEMEQEFCPNTNDVMESLRSAVRNLLK